MADSNYSILASLSAVITFEYRVYRPDGALFRTFTSDKATGVGDPSSYSTSTNFDTPPGSLANALSVAIPHRLIYCRQMISWKCEVFAKIITTGTPDTPVYRKLFTGYIGKISIKGNTSDMEIIALYDRAKSKSKMIVSSNCPLEFGGVQCGIPKNGVWIAPITQTAQQLTFAPTTVALDASLPYRVTIGDDVLNVIGSSINGGGQLTGLTLNRPLLARPDIIFFARGCDQTIQTCEKYQNTVNYRGAVVESSILSITL